MQNKRELAKLIIQEPEYESREQTNYTQEKNDLIRERAFSISPTVKLAKSSDFFKRTRVNSCSYVVVKNGIAQAIPYRPKPKPIEFSPLYNQSENQ